MQDAPHDTAKQTTPQRIMQLAFGYAPPLILLSAIQHRVFDTLDGGPKTLEQMAEATGASKRGLRAIMDALVALEFLTRDPEGRYALTPETATFLVRGKPGYFGGLIQHTAGQILGNWMALPEVVKTGKPARDRSGEADGAAFFEQFVESLFPMGYPAAQALGRALHLADARQPVRVLDIAAGSGVWGIALAQQSPQVTVTAVDWEGVLPVTRRIVERFGLSDRFTFVPGDIRTADFGHGHNIATLGHILHTEGPTRSQGLLRKAFDALAPGGTIAIAEMLMNEERTGPPHAAIFAVNMLVHSDEGDTFSFGDIAGWLRDAGFTDPRTLDAPGPSPLILATKPG